MPSAVRPKIKITPPYCTSGPDGKKVQMGFFALKRGEAMALGGIWGKGEGGWVKATVLV